MTQTPPLAPKHPQVLTQHGDRRIDNYFWLRESTSETIAYLEAENRYTQDHMEHTQALQKTLYEEMLARIKETDLSVPFRLDDYYYYVRTEQGKAYAIFCRKRDWEAPEEVLLDQNKLAEGRSFFSLGVQSVSPNHQLLAYSVDTTGAELYTLYFLDLTTKQLYPETIPDTYYSFAWANDNRTVFYTKVDEANRPFQLWRHVLGTEPNNDTLIYQEDDEAFFLSVGRTRSRAYILMDLSSQVTSEVYYLKADCATESFQVIHPRQPGMEYAVEHHTDRFYIVTNEEAINFKLMQAPVSAPSKKNWQTLIPHRPDVMLSGIDAFTDHLVITERTAGLPTVRVRKLSTDKETQLTFPEPTYALFGNENPDFNSSIWRFTYTSMITPTSVFDYNLDTGEQELKKETEVLGGYDRTQYASERLMATAPDGTQIPISLVYKRDTPKDGSSPLWLTGYGSYGYAYPATFSSNRLSLLDRGIILAIAHIRGGSDMGRQWYEDGKLLKKKNTFTDFIAGAEYLIQQQWTKPDRLVISGGSAGGLLMGAVINLRPDLCKAVVADVPFVDVLTTILDSSLPLTVIEWDEWGNPNEPTYYDYIKSYSPYDNVEVKPYPALLITAGLYDSRVKYWEPAKWAAKLRTVKTDNNVLLLKTNMEAGHGGASGRYESLKELAFEYAFVLDQLGKVSS